MSHGARQTKKGVSWKTWGGKRKIFAHGFIQERTKKKKNKAGEAVGEETYKVALIRWHPPARYPIYGIRGTSVLSAYLHNKSLPKRVEANLAGLAARKLDQKIKYLLERAR